MVTPQFVPADPAIGEPLYVQIRSQIESAIDKGLLGRGEMLQPERDLAEVFGVTRVTVRQALNNLEARGVVVRRRGSGTFVSDRLRLEDVLSFSDKVRDQGQIPGSKLLRAEIVSGIPSVNSALRIAPGTDLVHIRRLRYVDNLPVQVGSGFLDATRFPDLPQRLQSLGHGSFYRLLREAYGVIVHQVQETIEATVLEAEDAAVLDSVPGQPAFLRELIAIDEQGEPIEYGHTLVRGDRCNYSFTLTQRQGATGALALHFDTAD